MRKKAAVRVDLQDPAVKRILATLLGEFRERKLGTADLHDGYEGLPPAILKSSCCEDGMVSEVDYDLAFTNLDEAGLVKTGPMELYDNPDPSLVVLVFFSKNGYSYLTEDGYKAAARLGVSWPAHLRPAGQTVHINNSTFHNSPVGVGYNVAQDQSIGTVETDQLIARLADAVQTHIAEADKRIRVVASLDELRVAPDKPSRLTR